MKLPHLFADQKRTSPRMRSVTRSGGFNKPSCPMPAGYTMGVRPSECGCKYSCIGPCVLGSCLGTCAKF